MGVFSGAFNSAAFGERARGFRVLFASAVLSASSVAEAEPWRITPAAADAVGQTEAVPPYAWARRAGNARIFPLAVFDRTRPWDLLTGEFVGRSAFDPEHLVTRAGLADGLVSLTFDRPDPLVFAFYSDLYATAEMEPVDTRVRRPGVAGLGASAGLEVEAFRIRPGRARPMIEAGADAEAFRVAGGIAELVVPTYLFAEGHLNGIQPGWSQLHVRTDLEGDGTRLAGGAVLASVTGLWGGDPIPGRGAEVDEGRVTAEFAAVWWAFTYERVTLTAEASGEASASQIHSATAEMLQGSAMVTAQWSRIVEPRERIVAASATAHAEPWRITPARVDMRVLGSADEDGRIALRALAGGEITARLLGAPWRIRRVEAEPVGIASFLRSRASVNLTNDAPAWRNLVVPEENRVLVIPYENRTMVVS